MAGEAAELRCFSNQMTSHKVTASGAKTKGDVDVIKDIICVYLDTVASGKEVGVCTGAERILMPKTVGIAMAVGDQLFWSDSTKKETKTTTDRPNGWCIQAAGASATTVLMRFEQELAGQAPY